MSEPYDILDRAALAQVFKDPRTLLAFEALQRLVIEVQPALIAAIQAAPFVLTAADAELTGSAVLAGDTGLTIDLSTPGVVQLLLDVVTALGFTPAKNSEEFVVATASPDLSAERVLTGSTGVTIGTGTPGQITITVNVPTALGYTPANAAGQAFTGAISSTGSVTGDDLIAIDDVLAGGDVVAGGELHGASLRVDQAVNATATASDASIPISVGGVTYYMRLSTTP